MKYMRIFQYNIKGLLVYVNIPVDYEDVPF